MKLKKRKLFSCICHMPKISIHLQDEASSASCSGIDQERVRACAAASSGIASAAAASTVTPSTRRKCALATPAVCLHDDDDDDVVGRSVGRSPALGFCLFGLLAAVRHHFNDGGSYDESVRRFLNIMLLVGWKGMVKIRMNEWK